MEKGDTVSAVPNVAGVNGLEVQGVLESERGWYDIKYLLGGGERSVERQYITLTNLVSIARKGNGDPNYIRSDTIEQLCQVKKNKREEREKREKRQKKQGNGS